MKKGNKKLVTALLAFATLILIILISIFTINGSFLSPAYLNPWNKDYHKQFDDPRLKLVAHGILAANGHNMQPWRIKLAEDASVLYLYADSSRVTPAVDPYARQLMITQGTFLEYVRIAGERLGAPVTIEFFPEGEYDESNLLTSMDTYPVAKITLKKALPNNNPLYENLFLPDTNRGAYTNASLPLEAVSSLTDAQTPFDISAVIYQSATDKDTIGLIAKEAAEIEGNTPRVMKETEEIFRPNEYQKNKYRYGFSVEGQGTKGIMKCLMQTIVTLFPSMNRGKAQRDTFISSAKTSIDSTPGYLMLITKDNSRKSQIESGMFYSQCILKAHNQGLALQPLSQPLEEYPEMKKPYDSLHTKYSNGGTIQMLLRVGYPKQSLPLSMRQDISSLLIK